MPNAQVNTASNKPPNHKAKKYHDVYGVTLGAWEVGLCGCSTHIVPNCLMVWCLPCVPMAQISARLGLYRFAYVLVLSLLVYVAFAAMGAISLIVVAVDAQDGILKKKEAEPVDTVLRVITLVTGVIYFIFLFHLRGQVRERYEIPGSCIKDFCVTWWCSCCSVAQMATHVKSYKPGSCEFGPPDTLPAYK
ncbi:hypothetical protein Poli38472_009555 [Pythium oligandrum]|uniref:PLAC8 family protein n=1 Tax=Pythium oligandrum TaxID=41045 RepID=A0A8K1CEX6_PYTOL|nr:hypothetical protein Poli38472_009555 [Pythium oligandrum]|eukprot:TMW62062.1 hypothetical protein Poli38472_009555 [Pythium oligandrum]